MAARKKRTTAGQEEEQQGPKPARKPTPLGNDTALTLPTSKGKSLSLSYWDVWFALVAVRDCGGDCGRLAERLGQRKTFLSFDRRSAERKRSHLRDLEARLTGVGLTVEEVVSAAGDLARSEVRRARTRVLEHSEREREWSQPMRNTPRKRRFEHALRGFWPRFPVSPVPYAREIGSHFNAKTFYPERASFGLSRTLNRYVAWAVKLQESGKSAEALALLRAWLTAVIELMGHLLDFLIWEDYGLTNDISRAISRD
jgi:hypothetical protein